MSLRASAPHEFQRQEFQIQGFTLVEMIVTIGIIIMAAGFIAPAVTKIFQDRRIENAASVIITTINEARNAAVTKKQKHSVVFLRTGVRLYKHPKGDDMGGFVGSIRSLNATEVNLISYSMPCANLESEEIPEMLADQGLNMSNDEWKPGRDDLTIDLNVDGTIDFKFLSDIPSYKFDADPPFGGDLVIMQKGDPRICYVDIKATGRAGSKVTEEEAE
ncbi:MAG: hypothetical protein H8E43_03275 [Planctomycetia bacterium]|mgnify:FL=1|nr:hypothetical protein [Planctomycetia bacterium]MBL6914471.1 hypothetical protein [Planctomycetota bacterium]HCW43727.1 hypothetical protein [Planctomycetota bacterium]